MKLTHAVAVAAAVAIGLLGSATVALAQDDTGPDTKACIEARAAVEAAVRVRDEAKVPSDVEQKAKTTQADLDAAVTAYHKLGTDLAAPTAPERARLEDRRDDPDVLASVELLASVNARISAIVEVLDLTELRDTAAAALKTAQDALAQAQAALDAALKVQVEACDAPDTDPNPDPAPQPYDLDCRHFPLTDGRTAQDVLDETPDADPYNLDIDGDRVACETDEGNADEDDYDQIGTPPSGGVDTGGGPA